MRYTLTTHPSKQGWYRVTDAKYNLICDFESHNFNNSQDFVDLGTLPAEPAIIATAMRELGDWLADNHYDLIFPAND